MGGQGPLHSHICHGDETHDERGNAARAVKMRIIQFACSMLYTLTTLICCCLSTQVRSKRQSGPHASKMASLPTPMLKYSRDGCLLTGKSSRPPLTLSSPSSRKQRKSLSLYPCRRKATNLSSQGKNANCGISAANANTKLQNGVSLYLTICQQGQVCT